MKKFISLLCAAVLLFSLTSCSRIKGNKNQTTNSEVINCDVKISDKKYTEDFKDGSGKVIWTLKMTYPSFSSDSIPGVADKINLCFEGVKQEYINNIKTNLDNKAQFKKEHNIDDVTYTEVTFGTVAQESTFVSVWLNEKEGTDVSKTDGKTTGYTFSLLDGERLGLKSLLKPGCSFNEQFMLNVIREESNNSYASGATLEEEKKVVLDSLFDQSSICCTTEGIYFYYSRSTLSNNQVFGIYECLITWDVVYSFIQTPEAYYLQYEADATAFHE